jgi:hypothetical protein
MSGWNIDDNIALKALSDAFPVGMASGDRDRLEMAAIMLRGLKARGYAVVFVSRSGKNNSRRAQIKPPPGF